MLTCPQVTSTEMPTIPFPSLHSYFPPGLLIALPGEGGKGTALRTISHFLFCCSVEDLSKEIISSEIIDIILRTSCLGFRVTYILFG